MLAASTQLAGAADGAAAKTARAATASTEASANVRDIASAADELSVSVNEIDRQVAQSNAIAVKAVSEAERTNVAVNELDEAAKRIGDVIKLITDIAEQTNLLALNATIEAARAGEAGRGFAVVAGEVKALAGQTGRATEEIGAQIAGMQRATLRSIEAITAIEQTIREIGDISGAIAAAVTEQGAATQEIARSVEIAARRTRETADEVGFVGGATEDTRASAGAVQGGGRRSRPGRRPHPRAGRSVLRGRRFSASSCPRSGDVYALSNAAGMWRGNLPGATRMASKRMSRIVGCGCCASHSSAAAAMRCFCRGVTASAASSRVARAFTSTKISRCRRAATMSISPSGLFQRRARMRKPCAISQAAARLSAEMPTRNAAIFSGRRLRGAATGFAALRGAGASSRIVGVLRQRQRALIDLAARPPGRQRHFADGVLDRDARERAAQQSVDIVGAWLRRPPAAR